VHVKIGGKTKGKRKGEGGGHNFGWCCVVVTTGRSRVSQEAIQYSLL